MHSKHTQKCPPPSAPPCCSCLQVSVSEVMVLDDTANRVSCLSLSPRGGILAAASFPDGVVRLYKLTDSKVRGPGFS